LIVVLISLSLLGLILLQTSWLNNLLEVRKVQLYGRVQTAASKVAVDFSRVVHSGGSSGTRLPQRKGFKFGIDLSRFLRPLSIEDRFSQRDVYNKLRTAFDEVDLKNLQFEFAITNVNDEFEMQSAQFETEFLDTVNNQRVFIPIVPESGTEMEGIGPYEHLIVVVPDFKKQVWNSLKWVIAGAIFFMLIILAAFYVTVKTLLNQKKLSEIKSDFINNMTHEFKTPLATISLAVDALRNDKVQQDKTKMNYFSGIIKEENKRMNKHVETILQAALMEKQELKLNLVPLSAHEIILKAVENFELQLKDKGGDVELLLDADNDTVLADDVHFANLISNLVDNAIKYSKENLLIKIRTKDIGKFLMISIEDNGIGMSKETVKRIFEKFYRAHTGNVHNVKGFGLGMSYVKTVIDAHKGKVKVDSVLGKGSTFTIEIPLAES
ncbi:MAG: HAMP domain-containing histidine kinase, partial [Bacteroidota bacterium]|nr:HAMP domain-containing histidine kinase [Bacteroidota bacterium]